MAERGGNQRELFFCHRCQNEWMRERHELQCPECQSEFVEVVDEHHDPRDHHISVSDNESDRAEVIPNGNHDDLPRHPLHAHNPWQTDPPDPEEPDIEHVDWNPAPGLHISYRSTRFHQGQQRQMDPFAPMFQGFSTILEGAATAPGRPPGTPRIQHSHPIPSPDFASQNPFPDRHHHHHVHNHHAPWTAGGPGTRGGFFTATGPMPGPRDGNNLHAVFSTYLQSMMEQGHGPQNGMFNLPALISSILGNGTHGDAVYTDEALDRIISQMMDQHHANSAPGPASAAAIAALPKKKADKSMMGHDGKAECSVCMDAVEIGDEITVLPCKHWFHGECVGAWLKEHDTCPHCRQGIMPKDAPETTNTPRSPDQEPRNHQQMPFPHHHNPGASPPPPPPPIQTSPMPGAFTQPGMHQQQQQQMYMPGGFRQFPESRNFIPSPPPPGPERGDYAFSAPSPSSRSGPPSPRNHHSIHRRRSSARERSSGNGEGSSGGGQGVTGWFRRFGGGGGGSSDR